MTVSDIVVTYYYLQHTKATVRYVEGNPEVRAYQTNDGRNGASLQIRVQSIQLLGSRSSDESGSNNGGNNNSNQQNSNVANYSNSEPDIADDLPF